MARFLNSTPVRLGSGALGISLLAYLVWRTGPASLLQNFRTLGWGLVLIIALGGVAHLVKAAAWRMTLPDDKRNVSFAQLFGLRLASEAAGQFGLFGQAFGETLRVSLLDSTIPVAGRIASVALDKALFIVSTMVVTIAGLILLLVSAPVPHKLAICALYFAGGLAMAIALAALAVLNRWGILSNAVKAFESVPFLRKRFTQGAVIRSVEHQILALWHRTPRIICASLGLNLVCQCFPILEFYLALEFMRFHIGLNSAIAAEALTKLINLTGALTPGNVGLYEGGNVLIAKLFGVTGAAGLAVALTRRGRALFWAVVGGLWLMLSKRNRTGDKGREPQGVSASGGHVAVILAPNSDACASPLPRVHGIPVLLRAILRARKAGASRIVVAGGGVSTAWLELTLTSTGRLPECVEFVESAPGEPVISSLFRRLADHQQSHMVIIDGACVFHPHLYRLLAEWKGAKAALSIASGGQLVGLYALPGELVTEIPGQVRIGTLSELHDVLTSRCSVECTTIERDRWQRVLTTEDRVMAEQKLDRWIVKPTDGIFARMNRKVSIPISHQLIKLPITPNMVSIFTLAVSILAGVFFACGTYWTVLLAAVLSVFASILDGCDGEVARLKLLESDFGCWLETVCDYLYYLLIYVGMAIGLARSTGNPLYLKLGGLLIFGAIATFVISSVQRHRLTNGRPDQLLAIWQKKAESRPSNPFLYLGRHLEFLVRRCFLPYALLAFAALSITVAAFILSVVGVNVAWMIALYSCLAFRPAKASQLASAPVAVEVARMPNARVSV